MSGTLSGVAPLGGPIEKATAYIDACAGTVPRYFGDARDVARHAKQVAAWRESVETTGFVGDDLAAQAGVASKITPRVAVEQYIGLRQVAFELIVVEAFDAEDAADAWSRLEAAAEAGNRDAQVRVRGRDLKRRRSA